MVEYLGLLRHKQAAVQQKLKNAKEQIGAVCNALCEDGISELSSDEEDNEDIFSDKECRLITSDDLTPLVSSGNEAQQANDSSGESLEASDDAHCPASCSNITTPSIGEAKHVLCTENV